MLRVNSRKPGNTNDLRLTEDKVYYKAIRVYAEIELYAIFTPYTQWRMILDYT